MLPLISHECFDFGPEGKKIATFQDLIIFGGHEFKVFRANSDLEELLELSLPMSPHNSYFTEEGMFVASGFHGGSLITLDFSPREALYCQRDLKICQQMKQKSILPFFRQVRKTTEAKPGLLKKILNKFHRF